MLATATTGGTRKAPGPTIAGVTRFIFQSCGGFLEYSVWNVQNVENVQNVGRNSMNCKLNFQQLCLNYKRSEISATSLTRQVALNFLPSKLFGKMQICLHNRKGCKLFNGVQTVQ